METLLNAPLFLIVVVAIVGLAVLVTGLRGGRRRLVQAGAGILAVAILLEAAALLVPTDTKKVDQKARALMTAIGSADWNAAGPMLQRASMYGYQGGDLARLARENAEHYGLTDIRVNSVNVKKEPMVMTARVAVVTHHKGQFTDSVPSTWDLQYQKRGNDWALIQVNPVRIGFMESSGDKEAILKGYIH